MSEYHTPSPAVTPTVSSPQRVQRHGHVTWLTHPPAGTARVGVQRGADGGGGLIPVPVTLTEGEPAPEQATPGELLAIAYAMFIAAALAEDLARASSSADEIVVEATCTFTHPLPHRLLVALDLDVLGRVRGLEQADFERAAESARFDALRSAGAREDLPGELHSKLESAA
jgi:hypothetical protein